MLETKQQRFIERHNVTHVHVLNKKTCETAILTTNFIVIYITILRLIFKDKKDQDLGQGQRQKGQRQKATFKALKFVYYNLQWKNDWLSTCTCAW